MTSRWRDLAFGVLLMLVVLLTLCVVSAWQGYEVRAYVVDVTDPVGHTWPLDEPAADPSGETSDTDP